ncbi:hypothetical protein AB751O23_AT_00050 [Chlamydiales bacterium SCGC AB-751-O23]|jgi:outer membrane protein TolC|nr:hypothetical protein AB751O23_AT_00050 [Chlamydiales bacterium SCGC AB-751-O23]
MKKSVTICLTSLMVTLASGNASAEEAKQDAQGLRLGFKPARGLPSSFFQPELKANQSENVNADSPLNLPQLAIDKRGEDFQTEDSNYSSDKEGSLYLTEEEIENEIDSNLLTIAEEESKEKRKDFQEDQDELQGLTENREEYLRSSPSFRQKNEILKKETNVSSLPSPWNREESPKYRNELTEKKKEIAEEEVLSLDEYLKFVSVGKDELQSFDQGDAFNDEEKELLERNERELVRVNLDSDQSEEVQTIALTNQDKQRVSFKKEKTFREEKELQKQMAEDLSENWGKELTANLLNFEKNNTGPSFTNIELVLDLIEGKHWDVVWEELQEEMSQQELLVENEDKGDKLDFFDLGNQRELDFALDLLENEILSVVDEHDLTEPGTNEGSSLFIKKEGVSLDQKSLLVNLTEENENLDFVEESPKKLVTEELSQGKQENILVGETKVSHSESISKIPKQTKASLPLTELLGNQTAALEEKEEIISVLNHLKINEEGKELAFFNLSRLFTLDKSKFLPENHEDPNYLQKPLIKFRTGLSAEDFLAKEDSLKEDIDEEKEEIEEVAEFETFQIQQDGKIELTARFAEQMALEKNKDIQVLRKELESEEFAYLQIVSKFYPKVTLSSEYRKNKISDNTSSSKELSGKISLEQKLISTENYYDIKRGSLSLERKKLDLANLENKTLFSVRESYYKTVLSTEQILVNQDNIGRLVETVSREKQRVDLGEAIEFDLEQSKVALSNAFIGYYRAIRDFKSNLNHLANIIGLEGRDHRKVEISESKIPVMQVRDLKEKIEFFKSQRKTGTKGRERFLRQAIFSEQEIQVWEKVALKLRPDMIQLGIAEKEAKTFLDQKIGDYYPELKAFANYRRGEKTSDWNAGIGLDWDLFDGLGREYRIKEAGRSSIAKSLENIRLEEGIRTEVRDRIYELESSLLSYLSSQKGIALAEHAHDLAKSRRNAGEITNLEYRSASDALKSSNHDYSIQGFNLLISYFNLRKEAALDVGSIDVEGVEPSVFQEVFVSFKEKIQSLSE